MIHTRNPIFLLLLSHLTNLSTIQTLSLNTMLEIHIEELAAWGKRPYQNNFFEIVYVENGSGFQCINQHEFAYEAGNVFLLPPLDCHSFRIDRPSKFYFIRFTDHYFLQKPGLTDYQAWFDRIAYILANYNKVPGDIIATERERQFIIQTIHAIHQEYLVSDTYSASIIAGGMASILNILARSIENKYVAQGNQQDNRFGEILRYLHTHLTEPEKLRIPVLAETFHLSKTYFSEYFKKQAGISLADYLLKAKLRLVETKARHTDLSLKEIAYQLNFTDSSHLARSFKKVYGMTVSEFRKQDGPICAS
ncbi:MAG: AraC family transcriptional regulator [Bacteroidota bacterium]